MHKVRVHEIAKELGVKSKEVVEKAKEIDIELKAASSAVSSDVAQNIVQYMMSGVIPEKKEDTKPKEKDRDIKKEEEKVEEEKKIEEKTEVKETEVKKVEVKKDSNPEEKPNIKEEVKEEKESEKEKEESLAESSILRRRVGRIKIIKKKVIPKPPKKEEKPLNKPIRGDVNRVAKKDNENSSLEELFIKTTKVKKKKKPIVHNPKNENVKKIDFERELQDRVSDDDNEEVVLLDFSLNVEEKKVERPKNLDDKNMKVTRKPSFLNQQGIRRSRRKRKAYKRDEKLEDVKVITIPENIRVYEFAEKMNKTPSDIIKVLFNLGMMVNKNDFLEADYIEILADEFDVEVKTIDPLEDMDYTKAYDAVEDDYLIERAPIITIMGHVDHGKTSLLDKIRDTKVVAKEAGGITQHIGAYIIEKNGKKITFLDTPGHEAFTQMRARGSQVTDIVIIVVAADDGVKPQTIEAIAHAKASGVPIIVAVNKIDKAGANIDLVKSQMAEQELSPIDWGGEYEFVPVSAHSGEGIEELLETILLQSEVMELKANPKREAKAVVVESSIEKGKGASATIIVQNGTLIVGDTFVVNTTYGKIRTLSNDLGKRVKKLEPGEPGVITGFNEVPIAGSILIVTEDEKEAKEYAEKRANYFRQKELSKTTKVSFDELGSLIAEGKIKTLPVIIKADVQGSLEAIKGSLEKLKNEEVKINIIHSGVGAISESDITLASASENSIILGFNVRPTGNVKNKARNDGIEVKTYSIIYDLIDDVKALLSGMMTPTIKEEISGQAEIRDTFTIAKIGTIAGCMVTDGTMLRNAKARLIRDGVVIYSSSISSLKRFKDDAKEVSKGYECGIMLENFNDLKAGDVVETYKEVEEKVSI